MAYCVVRTDKMTGTDQRVDVRSGMFYNGSNAKANVENGVIVEIGAFEGREIHKVTAATSSSKLDVCGLVCTPELTYDDRKSALEDFINEAGRPVRVYVLRQHGQFSITKDGFVGGTAAVKDAEVGIGTGGKIDASGTGFGKCVHIETVGGRTWYDIEIGNVEGSSAASDDE